MVKFLAIRGEQHPIRLSYYALKMLKEKLGISVTEMKDDDYKAYECLLYYSLKKGAEVEGKEMPFDEDEMENVMDEVFFEFVALIPSFFPQIESQIKQTKGGSKVLEPKK